MELLLILDCVMGWKSKADATIAFRGTLVMLGDVFNEKKRIYMAFLRWEWLQPHLRPSSRFFWRDYAVLHKPIQIRICKTKYTHTHHVCDPSYYKNPTRIVLSVARCFYETIVGESCDSRSTNLTIIAWFVARVIFVKKAPWREPTSYRLKCRRAAH